jgi:FkbM family methyltransferase
LPISRFADYDYTHLIETANLTQSAAMDRPLFRARLFRSLRLLSGLPGWRRIVNLSVPPHSAKFTVRNKGVYFTGDMESYVDREVFLYGEYEQAEIAAFLKHIPPDRRGTMLDVGGNVGNHSLAFARPFKSVHAFEPNPMLWEQFQKNVSLNSLVGTVHLHHIGLADRDDELTLHLIDKPNFGLGTFSKVEQYDLPLKPTAICPIRHGGTYLESIGVRSVDAIKIDVQGFEPEVLVGLADVLKRDRPIVWCEIAAGTLTKMDSMEALQKLVPFQFKLLVLRRGDFQPITTSAKLESGNYLILPT